MFKEITKWNTPVTMKDILYVLEYPNFWDIPCFLAIKWHKETWRRKHEHAIVLLLWDFQLRSMCDRIPTEKHVWDSNINFYLQYKQTGSSSIASQVSTSTVVSPCLCTRATYISICRWVVAGTSRDIIDIGISYDILLYFEISGNISLKIGIFYSVWGII